MKLVLLVNDLTKLNHLSTSNLETIVLQHAVNVNTVRKIKSQVFNYAFGEGLSDNIDSSIIVI